MGVDLHVAYNCVFTVLPLPACTYIVHTVFHQWNRHSIVQFDSHPIKYKDLNNLNVLISQFLKKMQKWNF